MMKPNFLCVGTQKAGTTVLYDILKQHPDIYLAENKEAHFFSKKEHYNKGVNWWLDTFFFNYNGEKIMGALTPEYMYYSEIPEMIREHLGSDIKLIAILRHPVDRAYSHYLMSKRRGHETEDFSTAIKLEAERIKQGEKEKEMYSYISRGHYSEQIERIQKLFPTKQLLVLSYEKDIRDNLDNTINKIQEFLEVEKITLNTNLVSNQAKETRSVTLQKITRKSWIKNILKPFFPHSWRKKLRRGINKLNSKDLSPEKKKLSDKEREDLFLKHYTDEPKNLLTLTGIDFSYWQRQK